MTLPETMKAMRLTGHGGLDKLEWREDVAVPKPAAGEVLVRVGAAAVNNTDVNTRTGWYSKAVRGDTGSAASEGYDGASDADGGWSGALSFPRIQGADCCGEIVAVGEGIDEGRIGERVLIRPMYSPAGAGPDDLVTFGSERDGGFAEYATAEASNALRIDSALTDLELASFPCAFSTAEGMIQRAALGAERVLITGASGGVGSAAVQLAKRRGAHVTAVTSPGKMEALKALEPRDADVLRRLSIAFERRSRDVPAALAAAEQALRIQPCTETAGRVARLTARLRRIDGAHG